jgi:hypothetical protein
VQILQDTGHAHEAVELLRGSKLGLDSKIGSQDPQLMVSLLLRALGNAQDWLQTIDVCQVLLSKDEYRSDDRVWNLLLQVVEKGDDAR